MKAPWQVIQRQNKAPLATGTVARAIPEYVAPTVSLFRAEFIGGGTRVPDGEHAVGPIPLDVYFLVILDDPDGLAVSLDFDDGPNPTVTLDLADLQRHGSGYLIPARYPAVGEYGPEITMNWTEPDGTPHTEHSFLDNSPVEAVLPYWTISAATFEPDYTFATPGTSVPCTWSITVYLPDDEEFEVVSAEGVAD